MRRVIWPVIGLIIIIMIWRRKDISIMVTGSVDWTSPQSLANNAGVTLDTYALARAAQNEENTPQGRVAIMWAIKNMALKQKISPSMLILRAPKKGGGNYPHHGYFARQNAGGKYCASLKPPTKDTIGLAQSIQSGAIPDPTKGATQWDSPGAQDAMYARGTAGYTKDSAAVAASRMAAGKKMVMVTGVTKTRFWV